MTKIANFWFFFSCSFTFCVLHTETTYANISLQPECGCSPVCPGDNFEVTCMSQSSNIGWGLCDPGKGAYENVYLNAQTSSNLMIGDFLLIVVSANPLKSIASLTSVGPEHNGTILTCVSTLAASPKPDQTASRTLSVHGLPYAPLYPEFSLQSMKCVVLSWTPPTDSPCVAKYTFTLTNITEGNVSYIYNTTTNATSKTVSDLTQGMDYSFTVAGVDTGGRVGDKSVSSEAITLDTPEKVTDLSSSVSFDIITVVWMPPPSSSRPPVTGYKISHNTTGSVLVNQTSDTILIVEGVAPGVYLFSVLAVNILGEGEEECITGTVLVGSKMTAAVAVTTTIASESSGVDTMNSYHNSLSPVLSLRTKSLINPSSTIPSIVIEGTQPSKELTIVTVPIIITSVSIIIITITTVVLVGIAITKARRKFAHSLQTVSMSPQDNLTCSENVAYDTVSNILKMSTQVNMTCSENIAYATVRQTSEDSMRNTTTSHNAVYDEVQLSKC